MAAPAAVLELDGSLAADVSAVADRLRRFTVEVRSGRGGLGSGTIWHRDGLVVTNAHVVRGRDVSVRLADGREFRATVAACDLRRDLASLVIDATGLSAAPRGDALALRPGALVLALGAPFGIPGALALGVVHATGPHDRRGQPRWVVADVRLAPGNSGGPLADADGRVIGINSMIVGGLAVAVPSVVVEEFVRRTSSAAAA